MIYSLFTLCICITCQSFIILIFHHLIHAVSISALAFIVVGYCIVVKMNWCSSIEQRGAALSGFDDSSENSSAEDGDFINSIVDNDGNDSSVLSVTKRRLSSIRKASVSKAVELSAVGVAKANAFSKVLGHDDDDEEEFAEIFL